MKPNLKNQPWFSMAVAACIAVLFYVTLTHIHPILIAIGSFLSYFGSVAAGCILAYILSPLANLYDRTIFGKIKNKKTSWTLSVGLTVLTFLLVLALLVGTLVPQLVTSVATLLNNLDDYIVSLQHLAEQWGIAETLQLDELISSSGGLLSKVVGLVTDNINSIATASASAGKSVVNFVIAMILSVYLLAAKTSVKNGISHLAHLVIPEKQLQSIMYFFDRCDKILVRYIAYSLLDSLIVGTANIIFMACFGMEYIALVSLVVAVTNLIPTFGPVIGGVIGAFILLLVDPFHALAFIIFTFVLQFLDGYVIKPRLFGNSLGVSGVLILIAVVVFGNMFGVVGILLAIPLAAIVDFLYKEELIPFLERKRKAHLESTNEESK